MWRTVNLAMNPWKTPTISQGAFVRDSRSIKSPPGGVPPDSFVADEDRTGLLAGWSYWLMGIVMVDDDDDPWLFIHSTGTMRKQIEVTWRIMKESATQLVRLPVLKEDC